MIEYLCTSTLLIKLVKLCVAVVGEDKFNNWLIIYFINIFLSTSKIITINLIIVQMEWLFTENTQLCNLFSRKTKIINDKLLCEFNHKN
jgi:hypothetical protein